VWGGPCFVLRCAGRANGWALWEATNVTGPISLIDPVHLAPGTPLR
jgi:hypothetical protein